MFVDDFAVTVMALYTQGRIDATDEALVGLGAACAAALDVQLDDRLVREYRQIIARLTDEDDVTEHDENATVTFLSEVRAAVDEGRGAS